MRVRYLVVAWPRSGALRSLVYTRTDGTHMYAHTHTHTHTHSKELKKGATLNVSDAIGPQAPVFKQV